MYRTTILLFLAIITTCAPDASEKTRIVPIAAGWAKNSINTVIFRRNSIVTDQDSQFVAYYDSDANVILAKRHIRSGKWQIRKTPYKGNVLDAHHSISIMVDGDGFLHMSWDHHCHPLHYCRSIAPGSLKLTNRLPMTGKYEDNVTYPEFYHLQDGDLLFLYRDGESGSGNLIMNYYDRKEKTWTQVQNVLIDGEGKRNAYWQMCTDKNGTIHLSWVWRETSDVATNHDICYAKSPDRGSTWLKSDGEKYTLPITVDNAEYACRIPQNSELINTTSMSADNKGHPYIATYWRVKGTEVPQYYLIYHDGVTWHTEQISRRTTPFRLSGGGTKRIPVSRPQIVIDNEDDQIKVYVIFRDEERGNRVSVAICDDLYKKIWRYTDLTDFPLGMWEPTYDTELWKEAKVLHLFLQLVGQADEEDIEEIRPQVVSILEWKP